ncbi:unnamed protein product [Allacma fusca]|uniref:Uncharacterized protein n=1 Tax=Allacma fusca TaxID=39272 RepID=A0A8J2Q652_9HEXA|nr:unnamed protein product [Allacma fusca]
MEKSCASSTQLSVTEEAVLDLVVAVLDHGVVDLVHDSESQSAGYIKATLFSLTAHSVSTVRIELELLPSTLTNTSFLFTLKDKIMSHGCRFPFEHIYCGTVVLFNICKFESSTYLR